MIDELIKLVAVKCDIEKKGLICTEVNERIAEIVIETHITEDVLQELIELEAYE